MAPYIAILLFESNSEGAPPLYREDTVLLYADNEISARALAFEKARTEEGVTTNAHGATITLTLKHVVDISPCLSADLSQTADLYSKHFRDYTSYARAEPLLDGEPL
ncbi:DUF4288 domain-containing protein [Nocardia sp. NPDC127579]|uniref:DUF4288 domain-containing protein n=1 Tax=Nocardia sp. NPDC127579 TaxID=3345402 RepID=UPI00363A124D